MTAFHGRVVAASMVAATLLVGCGSGKHVTVHVSAGSEVFDQPVITTVTGLSADQSVTVKATFDDRGGSEWTSSAVFRADAQGRVSTQQAPISGSYTRADPMGLIETLSTGSLGARVDSQPPWKFTFTASVGSHRVGSASTERTGPLSTGVHAISETVSKSGLDGTVYLPAKTSGAPMPGVVVFGGSGGGLETAVAASALATHGIPAFALAYFHAPGLPAQLDHIPLKYFASAVKLLARQAGVDAAQIDLWGMSRGSEAALLTAVDFPTVVDGVIGAVPSAETFGGVGADAQTVAAWTFEGRPVAIGASGDFSAQRDDVPATIPVERIRGPVLLICGTADEVWNSCDNSSVIAARRAARGASAPTILRYAGAGHGIGTATPYIPDTTSTGHTAGGELLELGGTYPADQAARADEWPKIIAFLRTGRI